MGAERAVIASQVGDPIILRHFNDKIAVKIDLVNEEGPWLLLGRVRLFNVDDDVQSVHAKLVRGVDDVLDDFLLELDGRTQACLVVRGGFLPQGGHETITLQCNTFNGRASEGSIVAWNVGQIEFHPPH